MALLEKPALTPAERRARREARRAAQRVSNVGCSAKFTRRGCRLNMRRSSGTPTTKRPWALSHWLLGVVLVALARRILPSRSAARRLVRFYSEQFDTVELNAPFYSWPTVATVRGWLKQAESSGIIYTVKCAS